MTASGILQFVALGSVVLVIHLHSPQCLSLSPLRLRIPSWVAVVVPLLLGGAAVKNNPWHNCLQLSINLPRPCGSCRLTKVASKGVAGALPRPSLPLSISLPLPPLPLHLPPARYLPPYDQLKPLFLQAAGSSQPPSDDAVRAALRRVLQGSSQGSGSLPGSTDVANAAPENSAQKAKPKPKPKPKASLKAKPDGLTFAEVVRGDGNGSRAGAPSR